MNTGLIFVFAFSALQTPARAQYDDLPQAHDEIQSNEDGEGNIDHFTHHKNERGIAGAEWANDIDWGGEKPGDPEAEKKAEDEAKRQKEERDRKKKEREEKEKRDKEERERKRREREDKRRREREERERKERERRDRARRDPGPPPAPKPPIRTSSSDGAIGSWLKSQNVGYPEDWMKLSPALRNELMREAMFEMMRQRTGMPSAVPANQAARGALFGASGDLRAGAEGNLRSWMNSSGASQPASWADKARQRISEALGGKQIGGAQDGSGDGSYVTKDGRQIVPQPPTAFGPWPGETADEWVERLATNMWQSAYDQALWDLQQQRIARHNMGYDAGSDINEYQRRLAAQKSGYDPQVEADKAYAKWMADNAAQNALNPAYREWLKNADENELRRLNMHRDGTMRVSMGVAKRGDGMGPQLNFDKRDAADAADLAKRAAQNKWELDTARANLARMAADRQARADQQAADTEARRLQRVANADAARAAAGTPPRQPATASWVDDAGNTHLWTSQGNTRSVTTIDTQGQISTQTTKTGTGSASASWTDASGAKHEWNSSPGTTPVHNVTDASGQTRSVPVTQYSENASASWTDALGNRHTLTSSGQGARTQTTISPNGQSTTTTTLTGTGRATASWVDAGGNTQIWSSDGKGGRTQTTLLPGGQSVRQDLSSPSGNFAQYTDTAGNQVTLTGNADGSRTQSVVKPDGSAEVTQLSNRGTFASWTDPDGSKHTLSSNGDGTRTLTTTPVGGKTQTERVGGNQASFITGTAPDGTTITVTEMPAGRRVVTTKDPAGNTVSVIRGDEETSASTHLPDGTVVRAVNAGNGVREVVTTKPDGTVTRVFEGGEPATAAVKAPDGTTITVTEHPDGRREITTTKPDGTSVTQTRGKEPAAVSSTSPDGTVVTVIDRGDGTHAVTVQKTDGTTRTEIAGTKPNTATAVSPDGTTVTVTNLGDGKREVTTTAPDGKTTTEIRGPEPVSTTSAPETKASATVTLPDGTSITITAREDGKRDVTTVSPDGKTSTETRGGPEADTATVHREDGTELTAIRNKEGKIDVVVTAPDGTRIINPVVETTTPAAAQPGSPSAPAAPGAPAQPTAVMSFTDELGREHTVSRDADGKRVETIRDGAANKTVTLEETPNGNSTETTVTAEGTTRTTTIKDESGQQVRITQNPDGSKTTVITDPVTGERTVIEESPLENRPGESQGHFEKRDADGKLISEGQVDRYGHLSTTDYHEDGSRTQTYVDRRDGSSTTLDLTETGFGTETVRDADGNILSQREVLVTENTDKEGRRQVTVTGTEDGRENSTFYDEEGNVSSFHEDDNGKAEPGRAIFERQRRDLDLSARWEDLPREDREAYAREQERRDRVTEERTRSEAWHKSMEVLREKQAAEEAAALADIQKEFAKEQAAIQARHEREMADFEAGLKQNEINAKREAYLQTLKNEIRDERAAFQQRYEEQVTNPSDPSQVRQFQINEILRNAEQTKAENITVFDTGRVREPDGLGGFIERDATPEEVENARIRIGLANNLQRIAEVETGNQIAKLEAARNYQRLLGQEGYNESPRDIYLNRPLVRDALKIDDLRGAVTSSGNPSVDAYERAALDSAAGTAHEKVMEGLLRGVGYVTMGLNDLFTSLNPADPFLQAAIGTKTSGADIGRDLSVGERLWQLGSGALDLGIDIGGGLLLQEATRMPGSSRVVPEGSMQNRNYHYDLETRMPGTRAASAPDLDLPHAASGVSAPRVSSRAALSGLEEAVDDLMPSSLTNASRNTPMRSAPSSAEPPLTPPPGLNREQLQDWHDKNAMRSLSEGSDGGDDIIVGDLADTTLTRPAGAYSNHLTQDQIDELFIPGKNYTPDQIIQKADLIRTGRAPTSTTDPLSSLALDISMRRQFPEISLRTPMGGAAANPLAGNAAGAGSPTQNFQQVLSLPPGGNTQAFDGVLSLPPGTRNLNGGTTQAFPGVIPTPGQAFRSAPDLDPAATQRFNSILPTPAARTGAGDTQVLDVPRTGPGSTQVLDIPRTGPGSTQVLEVPKFQNQTPILHNDASAITQPVAGSTLKTQTPPSVGAPREGNLIQPSGDSGGLTLKPTIQPRPITDDMLYSANPPRPMDQNLTTKYPDTQRDAQLARERVENWVDNPHIEAQLDAEVREMLKIGAEAGSPDARRVLENTPAYGYQPDMDAHLGLYDPAENVFRLNPYKTNPSGAGERLQTRDPVALAGTMVHEAVHGRGLPNQIPNRGGGSGAPPAAPAGTPKAELPAGQGQGAGYNEFRAFYAEGQFYHRMREVDPKLLDGLDPSSRRLADAFTDAVAKKDPQALRDAISAEIERRRYERFYTTPEQYGQALTQHRGGSNLRAEEALSKGAQAQTLAGDNIDLKKVFPPPPEPAKMPGQIAPLPGPPAPLPQKPTIVYPGGKTPAPSSDTALSPEGATPLPAAEVPDRTLQEKIGNSFSTAEQQVSALKEDSTFEKK